MGNITHELVTRLNQGPAVLFLGQKYLKLETDQDPFIDTIVQKFGVDPSTKPNYDCIINDKISAAPEAAMAWMYNRSERIASPLGLK